MSFWHVRFTRGLPVAESLVRKKARRAVTTQIGHRHAIAGCRQHRGYLDEAVNVVWPAMQENDICAVGRTSLCISEIQEAWVNVLHWAK
ncbi:hypothetical protein XH99_01220 [Bradyrhizobium nanningense]|uniref:Uncharacterized protein n=1 Tax=Bradyrhizobium nanningense TaxID=1325118 RepID=A0A4Q0SK35_9BRAD|nr:hypothetical protein XH84_33115 [Bradyrhizobium nanningense]RXH38401.1 hypothetical protein XH99_01220 [Bradyrhizobium nanningense]